MVFSERQVRFIAGERCEFWMSMLLYIGEVLHVPGIHSEADSPLRYDLYLWRGEPVVSANRSLEPWTVCRFTMH
jgi:hypothetical protein